MIEAKHSVNIKANLRGFDVQVTVRTDDGDIFAMFEVAMAKLEALGAVPERRWENNRKGEGESKATKTQVSKEPAFPVCPEHRVSRVGRNGYFCPTKLDDGTWCDWKAPPLNGGA
jgi:hypothetical protein